MRIVLAVHCFFPRHYFGTERYTLDLATNLRDLGHDVSIVTSTFPDDPGNEDLITCGTWANIPVYTVDKTRVPAHGVRDSYEQPSMIPILTQLISSLEPDVLHITHLMNHTTALLQVASTLSVPVMATFTDFFALCLNDTLLDIHGSLCPGPSRSRSNCIACHLAGSNHRSGPAKPSSFPGSRCGYTLASHFLSQLAGAPLVRNTTVGRDALAIVQRPAIMRTRYASYMAAIAPTRFLRDVHIAHGFGFPIHLIRYGVDIDRLDAFPRANNAPLRFGFMGQIAHHKGVHLLIDVFRHFPLLSAELHIFGPPESHPQYYSELQRKAPPSTHFHGSYAPATLSAHLGELDFLVIPSLWYENSPFVLLQALAHQIPVIVSDVPGMVELVDDGVNGYVFRRSDSRDLRRVLCNLIRDPAAARSLSTTTRYEHTTRAMTEATLALYRSIVHP